LDQTGREAIIINYASEEVTEFLNSTSRHERLFSAMLYKPPSGTFAFNKLTEMFVMEDDQARIILQHSCSACAK